jgi:RsmE family RNA methyltransferase
MNLIIIHPDELDAQGRCVLADERALHIRTILKAEEGKTLRIGLLNWTLGTGLTMQVDRHEVVMDCTFESEIPPKPRIDLLLAMPRPKVMKRLWPQLAALGLGRIVLLRADKVERYYFDSHVLDPEFYTKRLVEGLQQAKCTQLPEVFIQPLFKPFVEDELDVCFPCHLKLLADPAGDRRMADFFKTDHRPVRTVLAIGPEGGWTEYERTQLQEHGFRLFGMGGRILRTDTAAVAMLSMLAAHTSP